jgi:geranylgeranyl diphosphate synthase type I
MSLLEKYQRKYLPAIEEEMRQLLIGLFKEYESQLEEIFTYHLGLSHDDNAGKRVRSLLLLLCTEGAGGDWKKAIPAAVAIELIHNFSLIHDDIEDRGEMRRGRMTVWKKWGLAIGLNAGDAMFAAAFKELRNLEKFYEPEIVLESVNLLSKTCLELTNGQHLDIEFEKRELVSEEEYFRMIKGKTAALLACSCRMGGLLAGKNWRQQAHYSNFGQYLGLAFQVYDDWLGIWGEPLITGKSNFSDLIEHKKSLPVILGFQYFPGFYKKWNEGIGNEQDAARFAEEMIRLGIEKKVLDKVKELNKQSINNLYKMDCSSDIRGILVKLANNLIVRDS